MSLCSCLPCPKRTNSVGPADSPPPVLTRQPTDISTSLDTSPKLPPPYDAKPFPADTSSSPPQPSAPPAPTSDTAKPKLLSIRKGIIKRLKSLGFTSIETESTKDSIKHFLMNSHARYTKAELETVVFFERPYYPNFPSRIPHGIQILPVNVDANSEIWPLTPRSHGIGFSTQLFGRGEQQVSWIHAPSLNAGNNMALNPVDIHQQGSPPYCPPPKLSYGPGPDTSEPPRLSVKINEKALASFQNLKYSPIQDKALDAHLNQFLSTCSLEYSSDDLQNLAFFQRAYIKDYPDGAANGYQILPVSVNPDGTVCYLPLKTGSLQYQSLAFGGDYIPWIHAESLDPSTQLRMTPPMTNTDIVQVVDWSGSMRNYYSMMGTILFGSYFLYSLEPENENTSYLIKFGKTVTETISFQTKDEIKVGKDAFNGNTSGTALFKALAQGISALSGQSNDRRQVLQVMTDGEDTVSEIEERRTVMDSLWAFLERNPSRSVNINFFARTDDFASKFKEAFNYGLDKDELQERPDRTLEAFETQFKTQFTVTTILQKQEGETIHDVRTRVMQTQQTQEESRR